MFKLFCKFFRFASFIILLGCFLATSNISTTVWGQTIHVIIAADGADEKIGNAVQTDLDNMTNLFRANVPPANLNLVALDAQTISPNGMLQAVDQLPVAPNDTIVFFYSGHGSFDASTGRQYLEQATGKLYRDELLARIERRKPRLSVLLTDCCNNIVNDVPGSRKAGAAPYVQVPNSFSPLFENLFVDCTGTADLTSSQPGELSFVINVEDGSIFTQAFVDVVRQNRTNGDMYWRSFTDGLSRESGKIFQARFPGGAKIPDTLKALVRGLPDVQTAQTVHKYKLPNEDEGTSPVVQEGPRLGLRAANHAEGVQITAIHPDSPASQTDIATGEIITAINGTTIKNEDEYSNAVDASPKTMTLSLKNEDGSTRNVTVEMRR